MKALLFYLIGYASSMSGNWLRYAAVGWVIKEDLQLGGDMFALYGGVAALTQLFVSSTAANIIRTASLREVLLHANIVLFLATLLLSVLCFVGWINFLLLLVMGVILNTANAFVVPAEDYFLRDLVVAEHLRNANHGRELITWTTRILFGLVAGLLIVWYGAGALFLFDACTFLVMIGCLRVIGPRPILNRPPKAEHANYNPVPMLRFASQDASTKLICLLRYIVDAFAFISWYLLPTIIKDEQGGTGWDYGLVIGLSGIGGILSLLLTWYVHPRKFLGSTLFVVLQLAMPLGLLLVGLSRTPAIAALGYGIAIFASVPVAVSCRQYLQSCKEPAYGLGAWQLAWTLGIISVWVITAVAATTPIKASELLVGCCCFAIFAMFAVLLKNPRETAMLLSQLFWPQSLPIPDDKAAA